MIRLITALLGLLLAVPTTAQALSCAQLAAALTTQQPAATLVLARGQDCPLITVRTLFGKRVTVRAAGSTIAGFHVLGGGNIRVLDGAVTAPAGVRGHAASGYALFTRGASRVVFERLQISDATYGWVDQGSSDVTLTRSGVTGYRADAVQAVRTQRLTVTANRFEGARPDPTRCITAGATTAEQLGLSQRACEGQRVDVRFEPRSVDPILALGGWCRITAGVAPRETVRTVELPTEAACQALAVAAAWTDGTHTDGVQLRGVTVALIAENRIRGDSAGVVDFRGVNDPVSSGIRVMRNDIAVLSTNPIALSAGAENSEVRDNVVARPVGSPFRAVLKLSPGVRACGNTAPDRSPGTEPCS